MPGTTRRNSPEEFLSTVKGDLLSMRDEDLRVRAEIAATGTLFDTYYSRMEEVHVEGGRVPGLAPANRLAVASGLCGRPSRQRWSALCHKRRWDTR